MLIDWTPPSQKQDLGIDQVQSQPVQIRVKEMALNKKLYTADDGITAGENFTSLKNYRYRDVGLDGILGMTRLDSGTTFTNYNPRQLFYYRKENPSESHLLCQFFSNTGVVTGDGTVYPSYVYDNTTSIPSAGNFSTLLWTDATKVGAGSGSFSEAPGGHVIYCNESETCIWGGDESRVGMFLTGDISSGYIYDYTDQVRNDFKDADNIGYVQLNTPLDSYTKLLLNFDGADGATTTVDSSNSKHTVTLHGCTLDTGQKKFGLSSLKLTKATSQYASIPESTDFNFGSSDFTIEFFVRLDTISVTDTYAFLSQFENDSNYWGFYLYYDGGASKYKLRFNYVYGGFSFVDITENWETPSADTWYHIALVRNGNDWLIFVDGTQLGSTDTDSSSLSTIGGNLVIGAVNQIGLIYHVVDGWIDSLRVSNGIARWTAGFTPPTSPYSSGGSTLYIGSTRPLDKIHLYINDVNTVTSTMTGYYWAGAWTILSNFTDGSADSGVSLAIEGKCTISFNSTVSTALLYMLNGALLYWYKLSLDDCSSTTSIYKITVGAPFQKLKDVWDGTNHLLQNLQLYKNTYEDYTLNAQVNEYDSSDAATYVSLDSIQNTQYMVCGFLQKQCGISLNIGGSKVNSVNAALSVYYWNGSSWTICSNISDGTSDGTDPLCRSGAITWKPTSAGAEFKTTIASSIPLYFYKFVWSQTLSADIEVYYVRGIPAPNTISGYNTSFMGVDRTWLIRDNYATCSATSTPDVFNGDDSFTVPFGDDRNLINGTEIYCQFGASLYALLLFYKKHEFWLMFQDGNENWQKYRVSSYIGLAAKDTLKTANIIPEQGQNGQVAMWLGMEGVYIFDGRSVTPIHNDIKNYFDRNKSEYIDTTRLNRSYAFFNDNETEYHLLIPSGTTSTMNKEFVYDLLKKKWYEVSRGTSANYLQVGCSVEDSNGKRYNYGMAYNSRLYRLEYGTTMGEEDIDYEFAFGDIALAEGHISYETTCRGFGLVSIGNTIAYDRVTITHRGDTNSVEYATADYLPRDVTGVHRVNDNLTLSFDGPVGPFTYHHFTCNISTTLETYGLRPKYVYIFYEINRMRGL